MRRHIKHKGIITSVANCTVALA